MSSRPSDFQLTTPGPLRLYSTAELLTMPPPEWLIDPIMPVGGLVGLYGPPGTGKSFIAIDMSLSVATGRPWQGQTVKRGLVLYVSAEGGTGIGKRVAAWLETRVVPVGEARVMWLTESISVYGDSTDLDRLMSRIEDEIEEQPALVVIDTLARCFDGDENQQEDMGRFIAGVDRMRRKFGATLLIVHHTRMDGDRERGNTAFRGAADTMLVISRNSRGTITFGCNKQKDSEEFDSRELELITIPGTDSCVVGTNQRRAKKQEKLSEIRHILRTQGPLHWDAWYQFVQSQGISRSAFGRHFAGLKEKGEIIKKNDKWQLVGAE